MTSGTVKNTPNIYLFFWKKEIIQIRVVTTDPFEILDATGKTFRRTFTNPRGTFGNKMNNISNLKT